MRTAFCCLFLLLLTNAAAERWTVQVFAYKNLSRAAAIAERLRGVGYDAYTGELPESSLVGVRIGCFGAQADAEGLAQDVQQRVALDALVVPFQEGAEVTVCVERELGFIPPVRWGVHRQSATAVTFWVEAAGRRYITFDGERWALMQADGIVDGGSDSALDGVADTDPLTAPLLAPPQAGLTATFRATRSRGLPLVRADLGGGSLLVAAGSLLWRSAQTAVVQGGADIFALRLTKP